LNPQLNNPHIPSKRGHGAMGLVEGHAGWWFSPTPLKNDGAKVSWDDEIPN